MKKVKLVLLTVLSMLLTQVAVASNFPAQAHISVSGVAQVEAQPDRVTFDFQAIYTAQDSQEAKQQVDTQVKRLLSAMSKAGFAEQDLQRGSITIRPEYDYVDRKRIQKGIKATRNLSFKLDDLTRVNDFLTLLVEVDISHIGAIQYGLQEPLMWQQKARQLAIKDAKQKAKEITEQFDSKVGKVYSIIYQEHHVQPMLMRAMESDSAAKVYQSADITINERLEVIFLIE